ncbi:MAG: hypothetical protein ABI467_00025 [Kofleriaceae bacterium]
MARELLYQSVMGALRWFLLAGLVALATGCPRSVERSATAAPASVAVRTAQPVPNDSGVLNDALIRDAAVRDATTVRLDSGNGRDAAAWSIEHDPQR